MRSDRNVEKMIANEITLAMYLSLLGEHDEARECLRQAGKLRKPVRPEIACLSIDDLAAELEVPNVR